MDKRLEIIGTVARRRRRARTLESGLAIIVIAHPHAKPTRGANVRRNIR